MDFSFLQLILDVFLWVVLPAVVNLLVDHAVGLLEDFSDLVICSELHVHLHANEFAHDLSLSLKGVDLGPVRVLKVVRSEVHARP